MSMVLRKGVTACVTAIGLLMAGAALAQSPRGMPLQPPPEGSMLSGVTVSVPKVVERERYGLTAEEVQLSVHVPYGDLDLKTQAGVAELDKRVDDAARYVCRQLEQMYPNGAPDNFGCVRDALHTAQPQLVLAKAQ